jgi:PAS domain S-box-containing protein
LREKHHNPSVTDGDGGHDYERLARDFQEFLWFLPDGFLEADIASTAIISMNRMACILLGYDPEDPPTGLHGPDIVAAGQFELLQAYHRWLVAPLIAAGQPYKRTGKQDLFEVTMRRPDGSEFPAETQGSYVLNEAGLPVRIRFIFRDITERKRSDAERMERIKELERMLPVCAWCHRIRNESGAWQQLEVYIHARMGYDFSHGMCPDCERELGPLNREAPEVPGP